MLSVDVLTIVFKICTKRIDWINNDVLLINLRCKSAPKVSCNYFYIENSIFKMGHN